MKLFVDYTNWHGKRAWREIKRWPQPSNCNELATELGTIELAHIPIDSGFEMTYIIHVSMVDKGGARRTLRLDHIHGFRTES